MKILHIASECAPFVKQGGLGDVVHGLARAQIELGHQVEVILPKYDCAHYNQLQQLLPDPTRIWTSEGGQRYLTRAWRADTDGIPLLLLEPHHPKHYFSRECVYGAQDDAPRFLYFCAASLSAYQQLSLEADIIHLHDWPTAALADFFQSRAPTLLTIHNLHHQGRCAPHELLTAGIPHPALFIEQNHPSIANLLQGGIMLAGRVVAVSQGYAREILSPEGGSGLHELLKKHQSKLSAVRNGIDLIAWNPATDRALPVCYTAKNVQEGKRINKEFLQKKLGLTLSSKIPLVGAITRLATQKAPHLLRYALLQTAKLGGQFVFLGSGSDPLWREQFEALSRQIASDSTLSKQAALLLCHDDDLARQIYAACDMLLIPSLFEPCGLTQMIAMRYGTVPIARMTGGLADTVFDCDTSSLPPSQRNGFTFDFADEAGVDWALQRALTAWRDRPARFQQLIATGMQTDFGWQRAASDYIALYQALQTKEPSAQALF